MKGTARNNVELTEQMLRQIEYILPKLRYSIYIRQVAAWLENFEEHEQHLALDFLFYLEYISFSELQARLNNQLNSINKHFTSKPFFLLLPYATYPKSNDIVMYLLSKCPVYHQLKNKKRIDFTLDIHNYHFDKEVVLVYIDDFIGTGRSFQKWYKKNKISTLIGSNPKIQDAQAMLAGIIMEDGSLFLKHTHPDIEVFADYRSKIFCKENSPFNLSRNRTALRNLCLKHGIKITTGFQYPKNVKYSPFGYDNSEALVAFDYGTPNNSLSIIWGDNNWTPIFPRFARSRMKKASEIKSEAAFYLGIMNKLKISFDSDIDLTIDEENVRLSARDSHSILVYLVLKERLYTALQICQVLGITVFELNQITSKAKVKKLVNDEGEISRRGFNFLRELKRTSNIFKFRENDTLKIRESAIFVPKTFRKMS